MEKTDLEALGLKLPKSKVWTGEDLKGTFLVTTKIDGIQAIKTPEGWFSRAGKPLYNLPDMPVGIYEVFDTDWNTTVSAVRTHGGESVEEDKLYPIYPLIDPRLVRKAVENPTHLTIAADFVQATTEEGNEGLMLRQLNEDGTIRLWKVKAKETYDVEITGWIEGTGRNKGRLGAFDTAMGKVSGFTDEERDMYKPNMIGVTIEVECMELTKNGKFRHPRFLRVRPDK